MGCTLITLGTFDYLLSSDRRPFDVVLGTFRHNLALMTAFDLIDHWQNH